MHPRASGIHSYMWGQWYPCTVVCCVVLLVTDGGGELVVVRLACVCALSLVDMQEWLFSCVGILLGD